MNAVERGELPNTSYLNSRLHLAVVQYVAGDTIPQEAPYELEEQQPSAQWPEHGAIEFSDVKMAYRPGLPNVLRGISIKIRGGEKIGVVGRSASLLDLHMYANAASPSGLVLENLH
jgi:ATP-binding cassette, subfamily C (CFTR/MRP), member 1